MTSPTLYIKLFRFSKYKVKVTVNAIKNNPLKKWELSK